MTRTSQRAIRPGFDDLEGRQLLSVALPETSHAAPAIIMFRPPSANTYIPYIAWTGTDQHLNIENLRTRVKRTLPDTSFAAPALGVFRGRLFIAWTGTDPEHHLNVESSTDGMTFSNKTTLGQTTLATDGPALTTYNGALTIGWTGTDLRLNYAFAFDTFAKSFTPAHTLPLYSYVSPSLSSNGYLYMDYTDMNNQVDEVFVNFSEIGFLDAYSNNAPSLATARGVPGSRGVVWAWTDITTQVVHVQTQQIAVGSSPFGPSLATDLNPDHHYFFVAWTGLGGHLHYTEV
jgi:hypothetical protein